MLAGPGHCCHLHRTVTQVSHGDRRLSEIGVQFFTHQWAIPFWLSDGKLRVSSDTCLRGRFLAWSWRFPGYYCASLSTGGCGREAMLAVCAGTASASHS